MKKVDSRSKALPWLAAVAFFMQALDNTILNTAIPNVAEHLQTTPLAMRAAIISYALTVGMLIPISGWLADRFGTKKIFIIAVFLFTLGSLFCAMSPSLTALVIARIIQGIGGAMMMPVSRLAILRAYPKNELLGILNFIAIPGLVGPVLGPFLGGLIVTYLTWHWIFLINIPIGIVGILFARKAMPNFTMPKRKFDIIGFFFFGSSLVLLSIGISAIAENEDYLLLPFSLLFSGLALLAFYYFYAKDNENVLIRLSLFDNRVYLIGIIGNIAARLGIACIPFLMPLMLQIGFGYSPIEAGMLMAPMAIGSITAKSIVSKLLRRWGYRHTLQGVTISLSIMISLFYFQTPEHSLWLLVGPLFLLGVLMSIQFTSMNTLTLGSLDNNYASEGNSLMAVTQQVSISFGIGISAAVLSIYSYLFSHLPVIDHFHYTFVTMGAITLVSTLIFSLLKAEDGNELLNRSGNSE